MKVCMITTSYPRNVDDYAGIFIHNLAKKLVRNGTSVSIVAPHDVSTKNHEFIDGIEIFRFKYWFSKKRQRVAYGDGMPHNLSRSFFPRIQFFFFLFFFFFKGLKVAKKCDIIHAHFLLSGFIGMSIKYLLRKPLVTTVHGSDIRGIQYSRKLFFLLSKIDKIISPHPELTDKLIDFKVPQKIIKIPNIIDFGEYENEDLKKSVQMIDEEFDLKHKKIVTFIARFVDFHNPITFIKSIPYVVKERSDVRFFLVGDGPLMNKIKKNIRELNIESYVILTGFRKDVNRFLRRSDVFIATSEIENIWSMTVVEAITIGVPCILTAVGYTDRIFTHLEDAYLVHSKDENSLASAILVLLNNKNLRKKISNNGKIILEKNNLKNDLIVEKTIQLYKNVLSYY